MKMSEKLTSEEKDGEQRRWKSKWSRKMRDGETLVAHRGEPIYKGTADTASWDSLLLSPKICPRQNASIIGSTSVCIKSCIPVIFTT